MLEEMPMPRMRKRKHRSKEKTKCDRHRVSTQQARSHTVITGLRSFMREWVLPIIIVVAVLTPLRSAVADWNDVPTGSMRPTILEGDRIWVNKLAYGLRVPFTLKWIATWSAPGRGDIVTLASPKDKTRLVKRVIGLPGDRIGFNSNRLTINGVPVEYAVLDSAAAGRLPDGREVTVALVTERLPGRDHELTLTPGIASDRTFDEIVVPKGQYFMMGDNRDQSADSRVFGFVSRDRIYGRSSYVAISVDPDRHYLPRFGRWFSRLR